MLQGDEELPRRFARQLAVHWLTRRLVIFWAMSLKASLIEAELVRS
jgi:hypothetical protein